jgi:predicted O-linked N-acetylglucosamine transferase (SPINDLY family)
MTDQLDNKISAMPILLTIEKYEQNIIESPEEVTSYWYLGLALLLEGREEEAQITWMTPFLEFGEEESEQWLQELTAILLNTAQQQEENSNLKLAWVIRQHIKEFIADDINNLLKIIDLNYELKIQDLEINVNELTATLSQLTKPLVFDEKLLVQAIEKVALTLVDPVNIPEFINKLLEVLIPNLLSSKNIIKLLLEKADSYNYFFSQQMSVYFAKIALCLATDNLTAMNCMNKIISPLQILGRNYSKDSIDWSHKYLELAQQPIDQIMGNQFLMGAFLTSCNNWEKTFQSYQQYKFLLANLVSNQIQGEGLLQMLSMGALLLYMEDNPGENRLIRNRVAGLCQEFMSQKFPEYISTYQKRFLLPRPALSERPLRIGYLSGCFRTHSVGFLAWWLLKYHDRQQFDVRLYSLGDLSEDPQQQAYKKEFGDSFYQGSLPIATVADKINEDEIDILVDLDSLTSYGNCAILALKPAPIQVTWLGYDATGFPGVDYFIADNYVLPESAQDYYTEKIWRLPQNYIGIDGFAVGTPTINRESLDIPDDGIIYFSSQTGVKRNPHNIRLQMQIIKQVPNSYFLLKSHRSNHEDLRDFIAPLAEAEGVDFKQLRFLPSADTDMEHRANLAIADIVLDTYPYNGATTTLETLWMGIPLVTRVGEQFAARNSYTMMMNVGVTEGLAWSDEEYVEWGVKLGKDEKLRQEIVWKLRKSRQTSPLWNGQKFAREMENAYLQMWQRYIHP